MARTAAAGLRFSSTSFTVLLVLFGTGFSSLAEASSDVSPTAAPVSTNAPEPELKPETASVFFQLLELSIDHVSLSFYRLYELRWELEFDDRFGRQLASRYPTAVAMDEKRLTFVEYSPERRQPYRQNFAFVRNLLANSTVCFRLFLHERPAFDDCVSVDWRGQRSTTLDLGDLEYVTRTKLDGSLMTYKTQTTRRGASHVAPSEVNAPNGTESIGDRRIDCVVPVVAAALEASVILVSILIAVVFYRLRNVQTIPIADYNNVGKLTLERCRNRPSIGDFSVSTVTTGSLPRYVRTVIYDCPAEQSKLAQSPLQLASFLRRFSRHRLRRKSSSQTPPPPPPPVPDYRMHGIHQIPEEIYQALEDPNNWELPEQTFPDPIRPRMETF